MSRKSVVKLHEIYEFFEGESKLIKRGENAYESNHVERYYFNGDSHIDGQVHASMKDRIYNVEIVLQKNGAVQSAECTCPRGRSRCHHMAALLICCHHNISVTDMECQWSIPKKGKETSIKTIDEMYPIPSTHEDYVCVNIADSKLLKSNIYEKVSEIQPTGIAWFLSPEPVVEDNATYDVAKILFSEDFTKEENKKAYLQNKLKVNENEIKLICAETIGQIYNEKWGAIRKCRLTASNFGKVLSAFHKNKYPNSLFKQLCGEYKVNGVKSIMWGREHEKAGISSFMENTKKNVLTTGLWLHESGVLGASPDGLVENENSIIEIKCPYKFREFGSITEILSDKNYIIYLNENNICVLNKNHEYYHQIQGTLHICKCDVCYLVVWTPKTTVIFPVMKDESWAPNINILLDFYFEKLISYITSKK